MKKHDLVVLLCDTYEEAEEAFDIFLNWAEDHEGWLIEHIYASSYGIAMMDGYSYIFIDARMVDMFVGKADTIEYVGEFFDELYTGEEELVPWIGKRSLHWCEQGYY